MASLSEYFSKNRYSPTYFLGDRVRGTFEGIPFVGTVANDTSPYEENSPFLLITLDLPIKIENKVHTIIKVKHHEVTNIDEYKSGPGNKSKSRNAKKSSKST